MWYVRASLGYVRASLECLHVRGMLELVWSACVLMMPTQ